MKFLRIISVLAFFQILGFLIALPTYIVFLKIGHYFEILNILFFLSPVVIALIISFYFSKMFYFWLSTQSQKKQLYVGIPLITFVVLVLVLKEVPIKNVDGVFSSTEKLFQE